MADATAWILHFDSGFCAAVGEREMTHIVETPTLTDIPQTVSHCQQVLLWEGETLPVIDLTAWLTGQPAERSRAAVGIVGWQKQPSVAPQYGALLFNGIPQKVQVHDDQVCDLPQQPSGWKAVAISCFMYQGEPIPILDISHIFSDALMRCLEVVPRTKE